jgi:hypothetical protein
MSATANRAIKQPLTRRDSTWRPALPPDKESMESAMRWGGKSIPGQFDRTGMILYPAA